MGSQGLGILALTWNKSVGTCLKCLVVAVAQCGGLVACAYAPGPAGPPAVQGDSIERPFSAVPGDPVRGREIVVGRDGNCLFCHAIPETGERFMGNIGPALSGVGSRLTAGQLRLRIVDPTRLKADAVMPAYHRVEGLEQVSRPYRGRPILDAQQVEDVIAYLLTLK
jgi:sulfur-oxidizing protein SoxX